MVELLQLDVATRLKLVQDLWDSIAADDASAAALPIGIADRELLAERLKEDDDDPDGAVPWTDARRQLLPDR